jgi:uncharacterized damage-inducible protein DinB
MGDDLLDPLRHNAWATRQLLEYCRRLDPEQLRATAEGTYGSILATLQHIVGSEGRYRTRLSGGGPGQPEPADTDGPDELIPLADDMAQYWEELATSGFDPDRVVSWVSPVSGAHSEATAGMLVAQLLNHGNEHRAQISTILTTIGREPPKLDGWSYGRATGRFRETPVREGG